MSCSIPLTKGFEAIVDDGDFAELSRRSWYALTSGNTAYAATRYRVDGKRKCILMHRAITEAPGGLTVDHINRNGLDNRRDNLRLATPSQNQANSVSPRGTSRFKGVFWDSQRSKWVAKIRVDRRQSHLGTFATEDDAARAYNEAALKEFGEFALLNSGVGA